MKDFELGKPAQPVTNQDLFQKGERIQQRMSQDAIDFAQGRTEYFTFQRQIGSIAPAPIELQPDAQPSLLQDVSSYTLALTTKAVGIEGWKIATADARAADLTTELGRWKFLAKPAEVSAGVSAAVTQFVAPMTTRMHEEQQLTKLRGENIDPNSFGPIDLAPADAVVALSCALLGTLTGNLETGILVGMGAKSLHNIMSHGLMDLYSRVKLKLKSSE